MPRSISQTLSRVLHGIAALALVAMMLVVVADVALRFFFNVPVRGSYDLVSLGLLTMVFFGIGPVIARGAEILIDLIDGLAGLGALGDRVLRHARHPVGQPLRAVVAAACRPNPVENPVF